MPGPVATIGSMHVCPMCSGTVPHIGGPVSGPGAPNVLINNKPAALMGDMCVCVGPPDVIAQGAPNVFFNGVPVVCVGDMTAHGGAVTQGEPNVIIGGAIPLPPVTMAVNKIPFPKITIKDRMLASLSGNSLAEAEENQAKLKEEDEGEPRIFNLQWLKEEKITRKSSVITEVTLRASVINFDDGETVTFTLNLPPEEEGGEPKKVTLSGTVKDKQVEVTWETKEK